MGDSNWNTTKGNGTMNDHQETFKAISMAVFLCSVAVLGIIGNTLVLAIYMPKRDGYTSTFFIIVLAFADLAVCFLVLPFTSAMEMLQFEIKSDFLCKIFYLFEVTNIVFSSLVVSLVAFDRYVCVCHAMHRILTIKRARILVLILILFSAFIGTCSIFNVQVVLSDESTGSGSNIGGSSSNSSDKWNLKIEDQIKDAINFSMMPESNVVESPSLTYMCIEIGLSMNVSSVHVTFYKVLKKVNHVSFILCILCVIVFYSCVFCVVVRLRRNTKYLLPRSTDNASTPTKEASRGEKRNALIPPTVPRRQRVSRSSGPSNEVSSVEPNTPSADLSNEDSTTGTLFSKLSRRKCNSNSFPKSKSRRDPSVRHEALMMKTPSARLTRNSKFSSKQDAPSIQKPEEGGGRRASIRNIKKTELFQNLRSAIMLFISAIIYIIVFTPTLLMANELIQYNKFVFNFYYINNAIHPVVYSLTNSAFRRELMNLFSCFHRSKGQLGRRRIPPPDWARRSSAETSVVG